MIGYKIATHVHWIMKRIDRPTVYNCTRLCLHAVIGWLAMIRMETGQTEEEGDSMMKVLPKIQTRSYQKARQLQTERHEHRETHTYREREKEDVQREVHRHWYSETNRQRNRETRI